MTALWKMVKGRQLWKNLINAETIGIFQVQDDVAQNTEGKRRNLIHV